MSLWITHYLEQGDGTEIEHVALLSLWLSCFVLSAPPEGTFEWQVIPIAIRLAKGVKVVLAPAILASLHRDFHKLKVHLASNGSHGRGRSTYCLGSFQYTAARYGFGRGFGSESQNEQLFRTW